MSILCDASRIYEDKRGRCAVQSLSCTYGLQRKGRNKQKFLALCQTATQHSPLLGYITEVNNQSLLLYLQALRPLGILCSSIFVVRLFASVSPRF